MSTYSRLARAPLFAIVLWCCVPTAKAEFIQIDERPVPVHSEGSGKPVIFVHGALSDLRVWDGVLDRLANQAKDHRLIAYTQRHFGPADGPLGKPADFTRETHVSDLIRLAETVGSEQPSTLVTWSYGGEIGLHAMRQRPDLFDAAIHYEPILFPLLTDLPGGERARMEKVRTVFAPAAALAKIGNLEAAAMRFMEGVFIMEPGTAANAIAPWPEIWHENSQTIPAFGSMLPLPLRCEELESIRAPTLVIQGSESHLDTAMMADRVTDCLGNALTVHVPGANHGIPMRSPQRMADIVAGFLSVLNQ